MVRYTIGVAFDSQTRAIVVRKNRPRWQEGKINFPGGKIEPGETPQEAMAREFAEEVGVTTKPEDWNHFATMREDGKFEVLCFRMLWPTVEPDLTIERDEPIELKTPDEVSREVGDETAVENLAWVLWLAFDSEPRKGVAVIPYADPNITPAYQRAQALEASRVLQRVADGEKGRVRRK